MRAFIDPRDDEYERGILQTLIDWYVLSLNPDDDTPPLPTREYQNIASVMATLITRRDRIDERIRRRDTPDSEPAE